jgi:hypothetical protein
VLENGLELVVHDLLVRLSVPSHRR